MSLRAWALDSGDKVDSIPTRHEGRRSPQPDGTSCECLPDNVSGHFKWSPVH